MADHLTPDLCIIGAGAGGLAVAVGARALGASVVLVERNRMGGDRLNTGSVPSKALVEAARHAQAMRNAAVYGIANDEPKVNFRRVHDHVQEVVARLAPADSVERLEALGVTVIGEDARFLDRRSLKAGEAVIRPRRFVVATGSRPEIPAIPGLDTVPYFTTETIFSNTRKLTHLLIVGGEPAALELAQAYRRLGSDVTVAAPGRALPGSDPELAEVALRRMREEGVRILEDAAVAAIQARPLGIGVTVRQGERDEALDVSHVLVAAGRRANLDDLDLDKARIRFDRAEPHRLKLSGSLRTTNRRVYVVGDAAGGTPSAHAAAYQAEMVLRSALLGLPARVDAAILPQAVYCDPELAEVGLTEPQARQRLRTRYRVLRTAFSENDRARAGRAGEGLVKLVTEPGGRILGAGIVGPQAGELVSLFAFAIANRLSARHLATFVPPYPTLSEAARRLGAEFARQAGESPWQRRLLGVARLLP